MFVIIHGRRSGSLLVYGPFNSESEAKLWASYRVGPGSDYEIQSQIIPVTESEMDSVRQEDMFFKEQTAI